MELPKMDPDTPERARHTGVATSGTSEDLDRARSAGARGLDSHRKFTDFVLRLAEIRTSGDLGSGVLGVEGRTCQIRIQMRVITLQCQLTRPRGSLS